MKLIALGMLACWLVIGAAASGLAVSYQERVKPIEKPPMQLYRNIQDI